MLPKHENKFVAKEQSFIFKILSQSSRSSASFTCLPQKHKATVPDSTLRVEMNNLEEQADKAKARELFWKPLSWLGAIRPTSANDAFDPALWETFVSTTLGLESPSLPPSHASTAKSSAWTFTATTRARAQLTQVPPRRTTGW